MNLFEKHMGKFEERLEEKLELGRLATFVPNKDLPLYNWFYFKEGFSRDLIIKLLDKANKNDVVLDPFVGSGTTLLACKEKGINALGFDVLPICVFASNVKTRDYDVADLRAAVKTLLKEKFQKIHTEFPPIMKRGFNKHSLDDIAFFWKKIKDMEGMGRDFLLLAMINTSMKISYIWKDGGVLKIRKKPTPPFRRLFQRVIFRMIKDYDVFSRKIKKPHSKVIAEMGDARRLNLGDETISAVITSPPYLNNINYTKIYRVENFFIGQPEPAVRSYMGLAGFAKEAKDLLDLDIPDQAINYFQDMFKVFKELHRVCKPGANLAIVVGNAYFPEQQKIVDSDLILSFLAEKLGFQIKKILILNKRFALEQRTRKKGILRESMILLEKG